MTSKEWFKNAGFGLMIHWGLYSLIGGEWRGERMDYIGEWAMSHFRIPNAEYSRLAKVFNPILFSADEWVDLTIDAGMKYMVFTSMMISSKSVASCRSPLVETCPFSSIRRRISI